MASRGSEVVSVEDLPVGARKMMQAMAAVELYRAQREVANYFELAYLKLGDMPDVAREVRTTANNARTQHLMTNGLMKKFTVAASNIVNIMIPMILHAVELQDKDIVVDCFAKILDTAKNMKKEAEDTQQRYHVIQSQVQGSMATIVEKNKKVLNEAKRRQIMMEREKELLKASQLKEKQLKEEKQKMEKEFETLKEYRDQMKEEAVKSITQQEDLEGNISFLDAAISPGTALVGGMETVIGVLSAGVNLFQSLFGTKEKKSQAKSVQEAFLNSQTSVEKMFEKNQEVIDRIYDERVNALERLAKIRTLAMADVGIGNAESLREASAHLGDVDRQFTRIIWYWDNMVAVLYYLVEDNKAGEVYLKKIENPKYAEIFKKSIARSEQGWSNFGRICQDYNAESESEIGKLYAFLSSPIGSMTAGKRKERLQELMQGIEDDIKSAFPEQERN